MIYLISGKSQTGKDTVSKIISQICQVNNLRHINLQFSFYLKEYVKNITDWDSCEKTKPRKFLQDLGTEIAFKINDKDWLIRRINEDVKVYVNFFDVITISDVRLIEEITFFKKKYNNLKTINIKRKKINNDNHQTEKQLDNYCDFDYIINNNKDIKSLTQKIRVIVKSDELFKEIVNSNKKCYNNNEEL